MPDAVNMFDSAINSLWICDAIWRHRLGSTLTRVMVSQSHHLIKYFVIITVHVITGSNPRTKTELLYNKSGLLNLDDINLYLVGLFMHKIHQGNLPDVSGEYFVYNHHIHNHKTRISSHLHVPKMFSCLSQTGIRYQGVIIWNKILMANINPNSSEACFKTMLKKTIQHKSICTDWTYGTFIV